MKIKILNNRKILKCINSALLCVVFILILLYYNRFCISSSTYDDFEPLYEINKTYEPLVNKSRPTGTTSKWFKYYVNTPNCQIARVREQLTSNSLRFTYEKCTNTKDIILLKYDEQMQAHRLYINSLNVECCYKVIERVGEDRDTDNDFILSKCILFPHKFVIPKSVNAILTECTGHNHSIPLQRDAFAFVHAPDVSENNIRNSSGRPSVLLMGIDSVSRMNFARTMPKLHKYFQKSGWHELEGYNKVGLNTFPNLMAVLTGYNDSTSSKVCNSSIVGGLDHCTFLWNAYKQAGYLTAYAEDWVEASTFNCDKFGFLNPPTDYYLRPFMLAVSRELYTQRQAKLPYCVGRRHSAEYVYDYVLEFVRIQQQAKFGLFWVNTFSHNSGDLPSTMDVKIVSYMHSLEILSVMKNTIIVFFSDHGMRIGPLREKRSGFLEESLPFIYIYLPQWFHDAYPNFVQSLNLNRNRLSSPYDLHATLQHVLLLDTTLENLPRPDGCPSCHSLFFEITESRSCRDAGIDDLWCTCNIFYIINSTSPVAINIAKAVVNSMNSFVAAQNMTGICRELKLEHIMMVYQKNQYEGEDFGTYRIIFEVQEEKAKFEVLAIWNDTSRHAAFNLKYVSRLDSYERTSKCVQNKKIRPFCICA